MTPTALRNDHSVSECPLHTTSFLAGAVSISARIRAVRLPAVSCAIDVRTGAAGPEPTGLAGVSVRLNPHFAESY